MARDLRGWAAAAVVAVLAALVIASHQGTQWERADFAFCNQQEISSLDPAIATGVPEGRILRAVFEGLTRRHPETLEALPGIATSWTTSDDGLVYTFTLRDDSLWTNGDPVTAHDFEYSFLRLLTPTTAAAYAYLGWIIAGGRELTEAQANPPPLGVVATSAHELVITLAQPAPYLPRLLSYYPFMPVHRGCLEEHGSTWVKADRIVTNGPFKIVERRVRDRIRLAKFEGYWGADEVALETIDAFAADGITTQLNMFLTGQVDWMIRPPPNLFEELRDRPEMRTSVQAGVTFLRFNTSREPFGDPRVRRALALSLDREGLARDVMRGGETASRSFVPEGFAGYVPAELAARDVERARALLAEAGYPGGEGLPMFELLYPHNQITRDFCQAVADQWRTQLGIRIKLVNETWKVYLDSQKQGLYDASWSAWIADYLDPSTFLDLFTSTSANNRTKWASAEYDTTIERAGAEPDPARRDALYRQAEELLLEALPIAPIYQRVSSNLVGSHVRGFHDNLLDIHPLRDIAVERTEPVR